MRRIKREYSQTPAATLDRISKYFDLHGERWISVYAQEAEEHWYEYYPLRLRESYACALIKDERKGTAIDLGCGTGHALVEMKRMGFARVVGVDISDKMLESAREMIAKYGCDDNIELFKCDVQDLRMLEADSVDVLTALGVIEYLPADEPLLREARRILTPDGVLIIQVKNRMCYKNLCVNLARAIVPALKDKIWSRQHVTASFVRCIERNGFVVEAVRFAHFYALFPLSYIPGVRVLLRPLDNWLSKQLEGLCRFAGSRFLASMVIVKARRVAVS